MANQIFAARRESHAAKSVAMNHHGASDHPYPAMERRAAAGAIERRPRAFRLNVTRRPCRAQSA
jgi:hypothetical protein